MYLLGIDCTGYQTIIMASCIASNKIVALMAFQYLGKFFLTDTLFLRTNLVEGSVSKSTSV